MNAHRTPLLPREAALRVARRLTKMGHRAYFAGGCVRDRLLGIEPEDYDIATDALPERVEEIFPNARGVGAAFGVVLVGSGGRTIEVATFRSDGAYIDSRHPVEVTFGTAQEDALRRDFTINGLFEDPENGNIVDIVDGQADLAARVLRAIGDPEARFEEDHLRMLRAVRFTARFGLTIDDATAQAMVSRATRLEGISRERIAQELRRMFTDTSRGTAAALLERFGLDASILGPSMGKPNGIERVIDLGEDSTWVQALVAWVLDRGVDAEGLLVARQLTERLVLSNQERDEVAGILETRSQLLKDWQEMSIAARKRLLAGPHARRALEVLAAEDPGLHDRLSREIDPLLDQGVAPTPLITGGDLLHAGFKEGPGLGKILFEVYDAQLEGRLQTSQAALKFAEELRRG